MGVWDETCGLTNTPIYAGDPAVLVVLNIIVESKGLDQTWLFISQVQAIHRGAYNGYGGVDAVIPETGVVAGILFHRDAWEAAVQFHGPLDSLIPLRRIKWGEPRAMPAILPPLPMIDEFTAVLNVANSARRDVLSGLKFRGRQDCQGLKPYEFVAELAREAIERQSLHRRTAEKERP